MIVSMYKRRMKVSFVVSAVIFIIGMIIFFIDQPDSADDWMNLLSIGIVVLFMMIFAISSRYKYNRMKDISIPQSKTSILELDHLVLKKDLGFFPRLLLFEKSGHFVGTVKPMHVPLLYYPISLFLRDSLIMMFPITYGVFNEENVLVTFKRKGLKKSIVTVNNAQGEQIGEYVQEDFKSLVNIKGELKDADGNIFLPIKIKGFSGDFTLVDADGHTWAHFYNGYFPHKYTELFRDMQNDIGELADNLDEKHKMLLIAMICFLFLERSK